MQRVGFKSVQVRICQALFTVADVWGSFILKFFQSAGQILNYSWLVYKLFFNTFMYSTFSRTCVVACSWQKLELINSFLACGELSGSLGNQDVRHKHWKVFNQFPIISSSADAFMHSLKLMVIKNVLIQMKSWHRKMYYTAFASWLYRLDNLLYITSLT